MRSLKEIWEEALQDRTASNLDTPFVKARMNLGYKIINSGISIRIYETFNRSDFYNEIAPEDYKYFRENGWLISIFELSLFRCGDKINKLRDQIDAKGDIQSQYSLNKLLEIEELKQKMESILKRKQTIQ